MLNPFTVFALKNIIIKSINIPVFGKPFCHQGIVEIKLRHPNKADFFTPL